MHMVALYTVWYNYVRQHKSLKGLLPAMAAGLSKTLWSMTDLAEMVDATLPNRERGCRTRRRRLSEKVREGEQMADTPTYNKPDLEWCDLAADLAADELIAGKVITREQADFVRRIIAQQLHILLISNCRPSSIEATP
jgi:molybdate-binding protein